jgi:hypothetical protein
MAVIGAHKVRLRSTAHSSYMLDSFYRHGGILAFGTQRSVLGILNKGRKKILKHGGKE